MGPLVPDLVTNEMNLVVALLVGVAFGFILEQAGFSSSRKLTGLFYGTDFTVLRVFFTAGTTAMLGLLLLAKAGMLDLGVVYVNPTFLTSAIVGGLVMGVGFVVGGYCPGTSFCGAAVGRIDAMAFVLGGLGGAWVFGEAFPHVKGLYMARSLGDLTVPQALGVSPGMFAVMLTAVAVAAFVVTTRLERRINPSSESRVFSTRRHAVAAAVLLAASAAVLMVPDYTTRMLAKAADAGTQRALHIETMSPDELAFDIMDNDPRLVVVDVRAADAFARFALPRSVNVAMADLLRPESHDLLARAGTRKVFVADQSHDAATAAALAAMEGIRDVAVLEGGLDRFRRTILTPVSTPGTAASEETARFRAEAGARIALLIAQRGAAKPVPRAAKKISGGCGV